MPVWRPLQSEHRTFDPEEADFFYVPTYVTCLMHPVQGWVDFPWYYGPLRECALSLEPTAVRPKIFILT